VAAPVGRVNHRPQVGKENTIQGHTVTVVKGHQLECQRPVIIQENNGRHLSDDVCEELCMGLAMNAKGYG